MRKRLTPSERQLIYNKYNGHCAYCGQVITRKTFHVDHVKCLRNGGTDILDNMLPSCGSCNRYKSTYDLETFRRMLSKIPERLRRDSSTYKIALRFGMVEEHREPVRLYFEEMEENL